MPPSSLQASTITWAAAVISALSPGDDANPWSSPAPMVIVSSVTPWAVAPDASPGPHGHGASPNIATALVSELSSPEAAGCVVAGRCGVVGGGLGGAVVGGGLDIAVRSARRTLGLGDGVAAGTAAVGVALRSATGGTDERTGHQHREQRSQMAAGEASGTETTRAHGRSPGTRPDRWSVGPLG